MVLPVLLGLKCKLLRPLKLKMLHNSTRYFADLKSIGTGFRMSCQVSCIKSILEVNRDARSSALFQTLVAEDYLISAFPTVFLLSVQDLLSVNGVL